MSAGLGNCRVGTHIGCRAASTAGTPSSSAGGIRVRGRVYDEVGALRSRVGHVSQHRNQPRPGAAQYRPDLPQTPHTIDTGLQHRPDFGVLKQRYGRN